MKAIIDATGYRANMAPLLENKPLPMLCIGDKPLLFHIIEFLAQQHISSFDIILNYLPEKIEEALGDGTRWGVQIACHLAKHHEHPLQAILPLIHATDNDDLVFGSGSSLPEIILEPLRKETVDSLLFMYPDQKWSGWGIFSSSTLKQFPKNLLDEEIPDKLCGNYQTREAKVFLSVDTPELLHQSNMRFISTSHPLSTFPPTTHLEKQGIWISRGASIHPQAVLVPPVFIGEFCEIEKDAKIGPHVVVEKCCVIDEKVTVENSLIFSNTYLGKGINVQNSIVDKSALLNLSLESCIHVREEYLIGESYSDESFFSFYWIERLTALIVATLLLPFYLLMRTMHPLQNEKKVKLPASPDPHLWKFVNWQTFAVNKPKMCRIERFFHQLPLLKGIIRGDFHFIGLPPRSADEIQQLPKDWRRLYLRSRVGIINPNHEGHTYTSEAFYAIKRGFWNDLKLFFKFLFHKSE